MYTLSLPNLNPLRDVTLQTQSVLCTSQSFREGYSRYCVRLETVLD